MSVLAAERIKLVTTRIPWWCTAITLVLSIGLAALIAAGSRTTGPEGQTFDLTVSGTQAGVVLLGLSVVMIMSTLAVTTEYRFGVIRTTFQACPRRPVVLLTKALLLAVVAGVIGEVVAFGSLFVARAIVGGGLELSGGAEWRATAGVGLVYALSAVLAVAVGALLRQSAGAVAVLLLFPLAVENLLQLIPRVGDHLYTWMPFVNANRFLGQATLGDTLGPWGSLGYFALVVAATTALAVLVVQRRDA
jgi:ABC-2 type transport system permease protein